MSMLTLTKWARRRAPAVAPLTAIMVVAMLGTWSGTARAVTGIAGRAVVSGAARFEVLSPTLIRTEYAGDGAFLNASTFNAIGRETFGPAPFTSSVSNGWLTIDTAAIRLRYRVGSGPFTADNLTMQLRNGRQVVTASPWAGKTPPACAVGTLCEAENTLLRGPAVATDHTGYTGSGFAAGFAATGDALAFDVPAGGTYQLDVRYANSTGGDHKTETRSLSVAVDGGATGTLQLPTTANWDTWSVATLPITVPSGRHTVTIGKGADDSGNVNIDSLAVVAPGAGYPSPTPPKAVPCAFGTMCDAETGELSGGAMPAANHDGYSGDAFLSGLEKPGAGVAFTVTGVPSAGRHQLQLRYANYVAGAQPVQARAMTVQVDSAAASTVTLAPTSSWKSWRTVSFPIDLAAGSHRVALGCPSDTSCHVNLDTVALTTAGSPLLAPHAPLGGYRRSLDTVDGGAVTTPGLLHSDGWSLLDDTSSAVVDPRTMAVSQRPAHGGTPYQDGYVFGYGQDYPRALQDLSTLTGPSKLLPRWAYGVWYSEYYDRTADDYQKTIVPRFRSEGVPLDVLVIDTDFKARDTWRGWDIDPVKFPDPAGFTTWLHGQGLHPTLNIHPSIRSDDPHFAQAQATAKNKLREGCGTGCYVFDFGDPDQLAAFMDLHKPMAKATDFWWLDWCCEAATSSLPGVTPDAWINQQYATAADAMIRRGFAFSRAYGSLQSGSYSGRNGLPTGPWADKRTTLHFTGDTISTWGTLQYEVGYTPGESVATGLSNISHDIGGHTHGLSTEKGAEPGTTKLPDDLYARWVQLGTFQPIDRLHSDHSDRLPWQYGEQAKASAKKFLNLRESLVPYTYTLAQQAGVTGMPIVRPLYVQYPDQQEAYAQDSAEYLYGPDVLVAPATTPGTTTTTTVWFPAGSTWTDYFTGKTYQGGTTQQVTTGWNEMPVFLRSGGILTTRTADVTNDVQNPLTAVTVTVAEGSRGSGSLYEDEGSEAPARGVTTEIRYSPGPTHTLTVTPGHGSFPGQPKQRTWTVRFTNASAPSAVTVNGSRLAASAWTWDAATSTLTVRAGARGVGERLSVSYR